MSFIYVLLGISVLFVLIGFIVNEKNAKYILSGYNAPYILIIKKNDEKIYYSSKKDSDQVLFNEVKNYVNYN